MLQVQHTYNQPNTMESQKITGYRRLPNILIGVPNCKIEIMPIPIFQDIGNRPTAPRAGVAQTPQKSFPERPPVVIITDTERDEITGVITPDIVDTQRTNFDDSRTEPSAIAVPNSGVETIEVESKRSSELNQVDQVQPPKDSSEKEVIIRGKVRIAQAEIVPIEERTLPSSETLFEYDTLHYRQTHLGRTHPFTLQVQSSLARTFLRCNAFAEAEKVQKDLIAIYERVYGEERSVTLSARLLLAEIFIESGKIQEGEKEQREVLSIRRRVSGDDRRTRKIMEKLVATLKMQEKYEEMIEMQREVLAMCLRMYGRRDYVTVGAGKRLERMVKRENKRLKRMGSSV